MKKILCFYMVALLLAACRTVPAEASGSGEAVVQNCTEQMLRLQAQLFPIGEQDSRYIELQLLRGGKWAKAAETEADLNSCTANFELPWEETRSVRYRLLHRFKNTAGEARSYTYEGLIKSTPADPEKVHLAVAGCIITAPWVRIVDWHQQGYFPHHEGIERMMSMKPDMIFFYGDQFYETGADSKNFRLDYLHRWLRFGVAFAEPLSNLPSVITPDDHDVYQGNLWGNGGKKPYAPKGNWNDHYQGTYMIGPDNVNLVHKTQCGHMPPCVDKLPIAQGISAWYTDVKFGGISFAVISDRMFKSGPLQPGMPPYKKRPDHFEDPSIDPASIDLPGLELWGKRQEAFIERWNRDWKGVQMKAVLSQSPLAALSTHHSHAKAWYHMDLDANGWPQSGRNRALHLIRKAAAVHIGGDQHLPTLAKQGIDKHGDAAWDYTAPAFANAYARAYAPESGKSATLQNLQAGTPEKPLTLELKKTPQSTTPA